MPQSLSRILLHLIFSTKNRESYFANPIVRKDLHGYLAATANHLGSPAICVGGVADHVHLVCSLSRTTSVATLVAKIKVSSNQAAKGICRNFPGRTVMQHSPWPNRRWRHWPSTCPSGKNITRSLPSKTNIGRF